MRAALVIYHFFCCFHAPHCWLPLTRVGIWNIEAVNVVHRSFVQRNSSYVCHWSSRAFLGRNSVPGCIALRPITLLLSIVFLLIVYIYVCIFCICHSLVNKVVCVCVCVCVVNLIRSVNSHSTQLHAALYSLLTQHVYLKPGFHSNAIACVACVA